MKPSPRRLLAAGLAACALATGALLLWPNASAAPQGRSAARYPGAVLADRKGGRPAAFPLRLATPATATPEAPVAPAPVLVGLAGRQAYLRGASGAIERVSIGESLDGWRLASVGSRSVKLTGPGGDRRIEMFSAAPAPATNAPTAP